MNINIDRAIYNFLRKLNTLNSYKEIGNHTTMGLAELTHACAGWICLINPGTSKIGIRKFYYSKEYSTNKKLHKRVEKIHTLVTDLLTNAYETEDCLDFLNAISKDDLIAEPIIYRNNLLGYFAMIGRNNYFYEKFHLQIASMLENVNSRLEIISLLNDVAKSDRDRMQFLASISHEFKTPLNSIIGFSDVLKAKYGAKADYKYVDNIHKSSTFLLSLIQDVLDLARSKSKPMELKLEYFRPKETISDIIWSFEQDIKERNIEIDYTLSDVELIADLKRFKQMIYNLISNAIKFNKINGKVTIVTYIDENGDFVFEIKDTGEGISKKDNAKMFTFFQQVSKHQLKRQQGSGIGLALCKTIAKAHGGDVHFKSRLSYGSTFWFNIPQKVIHNTQTRETRTREMCFTN